MSSGVQRERIRAWLRSLLADHRLEVPELALRAKISPSTVYRLLDDKYPFEPRPATLRRIAEAMGERVPRDDDEAQPFPAGAGDVQPIAKTSIPDGLAPGAQDGLAPGAQQDVWRVATRALELAGYLPGDVLLVERGISPRPGDIVCAQVYNLERGQMETRLRLFRPPFLVTHTMDPEAEEQPLFVDGDRVVIMGTVIRSLRSRAA